MGIEIYGVLFKKFEELSLLKGEDNVTSKAMHLENLNRGSYHKNLVTIRRILFEICLVLGFFVWDWSLFPIPLPSLAFDHHQKQ